MVTKLFIKTNTENVIFTTPYWYFDEEVIFKRYMPHSWKKNTDKKFTRKITKKRYCKISFKIA